ncbi:hypothetical protein ABIF69_011180 [Bradyrhizobium japonicum]
MDFLPDSGEDSCCESGAKMTKKSRRTHSPAFKAKVADFTDREHRFRAIVSTEFRRS